MGFCQPYFNISPYLGSPWFVRAEEGEGQQGHHCLQHNVHRGTVSAFPSGALALLENRGQ